MTFVDKTTETQAEKDIELYSLFLYNDGMTIKLCMRKKVAGNKTGK